MEPSWQTIFLDALLTLDQREAPHGLYGIRQAYAKPSNRVPSLAQVLKTPGSPGFIEKLGFKQGYSGRGPERLDFFAPPDHGVQLRVLDYALTKVRSFGSSYRLDAHNHKEPREPRWDLERLIPKLSSDQAVLLAAHAPTMNRIHVLLDRALDASFLQRYHVALFQREWEDRYGRNFHSGLYLWSGTTNTPE